MSQQVSILGCGWLGLPLAKHLLKLGFTVKGSTTSTDKLTQLKSFGINPFLIKCDPDLKPKDPHSFFESTHLFLNIPYRRNLKDPLEYQQQIDSVIQHVNSSSIKHVIFASSTSVYPLNMKEAKEDVEFKPDNRRAEVLLDIEQGLLSNQNFQSTVIRFAGLYGASRKIGNFLAAQKQVKRPNFPVNLIHLDDCVTIITQIINEKIYNQIFNAVSDRHPLRRELYTKAAEHLGLKPPDFIDESEVQTKIVSNEKLKKHLNYQFKYPDPLQSF